LATKLLYKLRVYIYQGATQAFLFLRDGMVHRDVRHGPAILYKNGNEEYWMEQKLVNHKVRPMSTNPRNHSEKKS
jgi:hypothetical protein